MVFSKISCIFIISKGTNLKTFKLYNYHNQKTRTMKNQNQGFQAIVNGKVINNGKFYATESAAKGAVTKYKKKLSEQGATVMKNTLEESLELLELSKMKKHLHNREEIAKSVFAVYTAAKKVAKVCGCEETKEILEKIKGVLIECQELTRVEASLELLAERMNNR